MKGKGYKNDPIREETKLVADSKLNKILIDEIREHFKKYDY